MGKSLPDEGYYLTSDNITDYYTWIEVDGKPLQVYGQEEKEDKIFGYIEAQEGKQFVVYTADLRNAPPKRAYATDVHVDGLFINGFVTTQTAFHSFAPDSVGAGRHRSITGRQTSATTLQPFLFSKVQLTDDDDIACNDEVALKGLGTIKLLYLEIDHIYDEAKSQDFSAMKPNTFHESAKKAQLSHQTSFGTEEASEESEPVTFKFFPDEDHPLQTFEFRYRSRQLLQLEGFIADSPTPSPQPSPSPVPQVAASPSPAQAPVSPVAATSNALPAEGSNGASSGLEADERQRVARLEAELESLRRQDRIATLERELLALRGGSSTAASGEASSSRKIKAEPGERTDFKRVKREAGEASSSSQASSSGKGKGKAKEKPAVIELSDSE